MKNETASFQLLFHLRRYQHLLFIIALLCLYTGVNAQTLSGTIEDLDSKLPIAAVMIQNKTADQATFADASGKYSLPAKGGDQIEFSFLGYYTVTITAPFGFGTTNRDIGMKKQPVSLDAVEIRPDYTPYQLDSIERRRTYNLTLERRKERSVMSPVSALAENISKKSRQRWQFQKNYVKWEDQKFVDTRYTTKLVKELTKLDDEDIYLFMNAYPMPADYARTANDLELKMWVLYNFRQWQKVPKSAIQHPDSLQFSADTTQQH